MEEIGMPLVVAHAPPSTMLVRASGWVTYEEAQGAIGQMLTIPGSALARGILIEADDVQEAPSTMELRALARDLRPLVERGIGHMAIASKRPFVIGVARMFGVFAEMFNLKVLAFRTLEEAERWLRDQTSGESARPARPGADAVRHRREKPPESGE
jgi:hypothetical protein